MTWQEVLKQPEWRDLSSAEQAQVRQAWVDHEIVPELQKFGASEADINGARIEANQMWDNGVGAVSSFGSAAAQGLLNTGTSAVQGAGVLTGSEGLEQAGRSMEQSVNETFQTNPTRENTNFVGNVAGNVAAFLGTGGLGGAAGKAVGLSRGLEGAALAGAASTGAQIGSLGTGFLAGAGGGAKDADQYGITGGARYARALGGGLVEVVSEKLGGMGSELGAISRIPGLRGIRPTAGGGFARAVTTEGLEEIAAQVGGNALNTALAPSGVETPGLMSGTIKAGIGGAIGGGMFGGIGLIQNRGAQPGAAPLPPVPPLPSERIAQEAAAKAEAAGDPQAAAIIRETLPTAAPPAMRDIPNPLPTLEAQGDAPFDPTLTEEFNPETIPPTSPPVQESVQPPPVQPQPAAPSMELPQLPPDAPSLINNAPPIGEVPAAAPETIAADGQPEVVAPEAHTRSETVPPPGLPGPQQADQPPQPDPNRAMSLRPESAGQQDVSTLAWKLRPAFDRIVERTGSDSVFISDLVKESGLPLEQVQQWIREYGINQGQATLDTGDWSVATEEQRAANVMLRDQERLYIQMHRGVGTGPAPVQQRQAQPAAPAPTPQAAPANPQPARRTGGEVWRSAARINDAAASSLAEKLQAAGVRANIVINDTGWPEGTQRPPTLSSRQGDTLYLNREQVRPDTRIYDALGGMIPEMKVSNPRLWEEGATLLTRADYTGDLDQGMAELAGPDRSAWMRRNIESAPMVKRLGEWSDKARVWGKDQLKAAGINPTRQLRALANDGTITGEQSLIPEEAPPDSGPSVFDQHGRITQAEAERIAQVLAELGVTRARFVINATGFPENATDVFQGVKGQRVTDANSDTIYLNRNEVTADTPMHEVFHGLIPELRASRQDLYDQGVRILQNSPAMAEIRAEYGPRGYSEERLMEEVMATVLGNESPAWLRNYSASAPWVQSLMRWIAKVRVWLNDVLGSRGIDPDMTLREFVADINRRVLAGQLRETGLRQQQARQNDVSMTSGIFAADARYLEAVEAEDMEAAQEMVYGAAERAGYGLSHRRQNTRDPRQTGYVVLFAEDRASNDHYGPHEYAVNLELAGPVEDWMVEWYRETPEFQEWAELNDVTTEEDQMEAARKAMEPDDIVTTADFWDNSELVGRFWEENEGRLVDSGRAAVKTPDGAVVFDSASFPSAIKSTAPVTYDENGDVIPLSQRFNSSSPDISYSLNPNRQNPADQLIRPTGLSENQPNNAMRTMVRGINYQGESAEQAMAQATQLYNQGQAQGWTFQQHMGQLSTLLARTQGNFNMTPGAYMGLMAHGLTLMRQDTSLSLAEREAAKENLTLLMEVSAGEAAAGGQFIKGFDLYLRIMADPEIQVENMSMRAAVGGEQKQLTEFKQVARTIRQVMQDLQDEALRTASPDDLADGIERIGGRLAQGDDAAIEGEVAVEDALMPEIEQTEREASVTSQPWFEAGVAQLDTELQALVDDWLITLEALSLKVAGDSDFSLSPQERSAMAVERAKQFTRSQLEQMNAEGIRKIAARKPLEITTPTGPRDVKGMVKDRLTKNLNRLLNGKAKRKKGTQEQIASAIANVLLAKAGHNTAIPANQDALVFAMGVTLSNEQLARESVGDIHAMLQANDDTKDAISQEKLKGFMSLMTGNDFSAVQGQAAPYGEKQIAALLRRELEIQNTTLAQSVRTAALQGLTMEQLEANLRDPFRGLADAFEPAVLDRIVNAVKSQYTLSAKQRAETLAKRREDWDNLQGAVREARQRYREMAQADRNAERYQENLRKARERLEQAESDRMVAEVRRNARDRARENLRRDRINQTLARRDRVQRLRAGQSVPPPAPLDFQELRKLLSLPNERVIPYLAREFGLDTASLRDISRPERRLAVLESRVLTLASQLGLNEAEAATIKDVVMAEYDRTSRERDEREAKRRQDRADLNDPVREARMSVAEQKRISRRIEREARRQELRRTRTKQKIAERAALKAEQEADRAYRRNRIERMRRGETVPPLDAISERELRKIMRETPRNRVIDYLAREFGFDISDLVNIARGEDRQATLEQRVLELGDQLGLTREQAELFMKPVVAEAMKRVDAKRKKTAEGKINAAISRLNGTVGRKAKKQPTAVERLRRLMELGGLDLPNIEKVLLNSVDAKEFTPEFKEWLKKMVDKSNDPNLPQASRDDITMTMQTAIRSAQGGSLIGLFGEWTMSNIFFALNTFKVNAVWGGVKAISDSALYANVSLPSTLRSEYGIETKGLSKAILRRGARAYTSDLQYHSKYLFRTGRSALEQDYTTRFEESEFELLAQCPDTVIRMWLDGKPLPPFFSKIVKKFAGVSKYVRRTMVATDLLHRNQAHEMLKAAAIVKLIAEQGRTIPNTEAAWTRAIDDAMYGGDFQAAKQDAYRQADDDIAAGRARKEERGILFGEYLDKKLGKSLEISETQRREILDDSAERARRWTNADQLQGVLGVLSTSLMELAQKIPGLKFLMPAIRMPINAFSQGLDYSPYGFLRWATIKQSGSRSSSFSHLAYSTFNPKMAAKNWHMPANGITNEETIEMRTKAMIGTAAMVALFIMAASEWDTDDDDANFYITGRGPTDPQKAKLWKERGYRPFMIRIGGVTANYQESPAFAPLAVLGATSDANRYGSPDDTKSDKLAYAITRSMGAFADAAVLRNLQDVLAGVTGSQSYNPKQAGSWTSRLAGVAVFPRIGNEVNTIIWGPQATKELGWAARALANVPFIPAITNKPAMNWFGEEIHAKRDGPLGEALPLLMHRIAPIPLDDDQMSFVAKMGAAPLQTRRRFKPNIPEKGGIGVMEDYDTMRKWAANSGKALRKWLTPQVMDRYRRQFAEDREQAEKDFDSEVRDIRNNELAKFPDILF